MNGESMLGKSHDEALQIFKGAKKGFLTLVVKPYKDAMRTATPSSNVGCNGVKDLDDGIGKRHHFE